MNAVLNEKKPAKKLVQLTEVEGFEIGKYGALNGVTKKVKWFKKNSSSCTFW